MSYNSDLISVDGQILQNITNALSSPTTFEHCPLKIYSRLTHALKILYFGIHLVDRENTLTYQDQFRTLFRALTQVVYQSTEDSTSAQEHKLTGTGPPTINQNHVLAQFMQDSSTELQAKANKSLIKACLEHIQRQDVKAADAEWEYDWTRKYDQWVLTFKPERTVFENSFVEWLLTLYMTSSSDEDQDDLDEEINQRFYRIRQLGLVTKVREKYPML